MRSSHSLIQLDLVTIGGWDHHNGLASDHFKFLDALDNALAEFYGQLKCLDVAQAPIPAGASAAEAAAINAANRALIEGCLNSPTTQGALSDVTLFTASDFGRALVPNGDGSDHAWGGNHIVMGGAVNGGNIYGQYAPMLRKDETDDTGTSLDIVGNGTLMPTLSVDQYVQRLGRWFLGGTGAGGWDNTASGGEWNSVLPNWGAFAGPSSSLQNISGFMGIA